MSEDLPATPAYRLASLHLLPCQARTTMQISRRKRIANQNPCRYHVRRVERTFQFSHFMAAPTIPSATMAASVRGLVCQTYSTGSANGLNETVYMQHHLTLPYQAVLMASTGPTAAILYSWFMTETTFPMIGPRLLRTRTIRAKTSLPSMLVRGSWGSSTRTNCHEPVAVFEDFYKI